MENLPIWLKRRASKEILKTFVDESIQLFPSPCTDFVNEFEFAEEVISIACDDFLTTDERNFLDEKYDEVYEFLHEQMKWNFGFELMEIYRNTCEENNS